MPHEHLGPDKLVIHVRAADVLENTHPDYNPVPVTFFHKVATATRLAPVILGQLGDDAYSDAIRKVFSGCVFLPNTSVIADFQTMRNATNIVISVSTFSWMAAWLSETTRNIYFPVSGLLNPQQRPDIDLIPINDARYHFYEFPAFKWSASQEQLANLIDPRLVFRPLTREALRSKVL